MWGESNVERKPAVIFVTILLLTLFLVSLPAYGQTAAEIEVIIDGEVYAFYLAPIIKEGRVLVPVRQFLEVFGFQVIWEEEINTVIGVNEERMLIIPIDSGELHVVHGESVALDTPAEIIAGSTFLPLRALCEALGRVVAWEAGTSTVIVAADEAEISELKEEVLAKLAEEKPQKPAVSINTATVAELHTITGIDSNLAQEIVAYREANGPFFAREELLHIPGISQELLAGIEQKVNVVYEEGGMASWYGAEFHGRATASGEVFDQYALTAAHRELPFGTYVNVIFPQTGRNVVVRINDRGPHVKDRIIDLSRGAAEAIGLRPYGTANVVLEILGTQPG